MKNIKIAAWGNTQFAVRDRHCKSHTAAHQEQNLSCAGSLGDGVEMAVEKWVDYGHTEAEMFQVERRAWGGYACRVHWRTYVVQN